MLKRSIFNVDVIPELGILLLFNSRSGSLITLDEYETELWVKDKLEEMPTDTLDYLKDNHFVLDSDLDEINSVLGEYAHECENPGEHRYRIMVTTCCNAHCYYCFEKGIKTMQMSKEIASAVSTFINNSSKMYDIIALEWFGGEPLMNQEIIRQIAKEVTLNNPNAKIVNSIITNGSLIDDEVVELFKELSVSFIQITLDGMSDLYNSIKCYTDHRHNFYSVLDNIELLINNGFKPHIRINMSDETISDALQLIDYLHNRFSNKITIYCGRLFCFDTQAGQKSPILDGLLLRKMIEYGYTNPEYLLKKRPVPCGLASFESYVAIDPEGNLIKCCEVMRSTEKCIAGDIYTGIDKEVSKLWQEPVSSPECLNCCYLPLCMGGCKASRMGLMSNPCFRYKDQMDLILRLIYERQKSQDKQN